jgi:hypothetical protein
MPKMTSKRVPSLSPAAKLTERVNRRGKAHRLPGKLSEGVTDPVERSIRELARLTHDLKQQLAIP